MAQLRDREPHLCEARRPLLKLLGFLRYLKKRGSVPPAIIGNSHDQPFALINPQALKPNGLFLRKIGREISRWSRNSDSAARCGDRIVARPQSDPLSYLNH
jgi:hypothetical protein